MIIHITRVWLPPVLKCSIHVSAIGIIKTPDSTCNVRCLETFFGSSFIIIQLFSSKTLLSFQLFFPLIRSPYFTLIFSSSVFLHISWLIAKGYNTSAEGVGLRKTLDDYNNAWLKQLQLQESARLMHDVDYSLNIARAESFNDFFRLSWLVESNVGYLTENKDNKYSSLNALSVFGFDHFVLSTACILFFFKSKI